MTLHSKYLHFEKNVILFEVIFFGGILLQTGLAIHIISSVEKLIKKLMKFQGLLE
jgi:hypothetical protein